MDSSVYIFNYITTNQINGKQYVGMHTTYDPSDGYLGSGKLIVMAIKKYGKENFTKEIIEWCSDVSTAHNNEKIYIEENQTLVPKGYNISPTGGVGVTGCFSVKILEKLSESGKRRFSKEEERRKMSEAMKGKKHNIPDATRERLSKIRQNLKHSDEFIERLRNERKGKNIKCPHCGTVGGYIVMKRWHFENCKKK